MLGVSFPELLVIFAVAFLVVGPERLSKSANDLGTLVRKVKNQWTFIKQTQLGNVDSSALYESQIELNKSLRDINQTLHSPSESPTKPNDN